MFGVGVDGRLNHRFDVVEGVLGERCAKQLRDFFAALRTR
jgi:tRNA(Arg) A34 adenosine deaminase TadA